MSLPQVERRILFVRGHEVMLDSVLAGLHGGSTKRLNEHVRRNNSRFPADFMFQLFPDEAAALRLQNATLERGRGKHRTYMPYVFRDAVQRPAPLSLAEGAVT